MLSSTSITGLPKATLMGTLQDKWSVSADLGGFKRFSTFLNCLYREGIQPVILSFKLGDNSCKYSTELRATNCHFIQYFIFLCTYQSMKQVKFSWFWFKWPSYFNAASRSLKETCKIRWLVGMYLKCNCVCHLIQKDFRCKYCANPQFNVTPQMHEWHLKCFWFHILILSVLLF